MGRLLGSGHPGRLLVLVAGGFAIAHLAGLLAWSSWAEDGAMSFQALTVAFAVCLGWICIGMLAMDSRQPGRKILSALLSRGRILEGTAFALLSAAFVATAVLMIPWNDEKSNLLAARYLLENGFAKYFASYAEINGWLGPHHPPLLPIVYAGFYALAGANVMVGRAFAAATSLLACALGYAWLKKMFGRRLALTALLLLPSMPLVLFSGVSSILDAPFWLIFTVTLLLFERFLESEKTGNALWCGIAVAASIMARYNGFLLPPIFFLVLAMSKEKRRLLSRPRTYFVFLAAIVFLLPWLGYAAASGTLSVQAKQIGSFFLVALIRPGGAFYLRSILAPIVPFMVGLWNVPLWIAGGYLFAFKDKDESSKRIVRFGAIYIFFLLLSLPNPRYLLSISAALAALSARYVLDVEDREGRGAEAIVYLLGLSLLHVVLVLHQTSAGNVYLFY